MSNILLLGSGTQALAIVKSLHNRGDNVIIMTTERGNYADCSRYVDSVVYVPKGGDSLQKIEEVVVGYAVDVAIPMGDHYAEMLSMYRNELKKIVCVKVPDYETFLCGYDKNRLMTLCKEKGIPHPDTIDLSRVDFRKEKEFEGFRFPALLKPNRTTGGRGMRMVGSYEEMVEAYCELRVVFGEYHLQRFVAPGGRQVKVQLYVNEQGDLLCSSVLNKIRWYPVRGGSSCCAVTIEERNAVQVCYGVLKEIGWVGFADFDMIEDPNTKELLIMELNPRLPACIEAAVAGGVDWGGVIVDDCLGREVKVFDYKTGIVLRHLGLEFLWFLKSKQRWSVIPSFFDFFRRNVVYQDFHFFDQKPFWVGTFRNIKKIL